MNPDLLAWNDSQLGMLGRFPDAVLARKLGVTPNAVQPWAKHPESVADRLD